VRAVLEFGTVMSFVSVGKVLMLKGQFKAKLQDFKKLDQAPISVDTLDDTILRQQNF
tara:strand:+ start:1212 stop:1382 length:171 start_codon:yes stop_codon:yes gene_type:complete